MRILLVVLLTVSARAWLPLEDWGSGSIESSVGESGQCLCHIYLPDTSFPADRVEQMQTETNQRFEEVKLQINKVTSLKVQLQVMLSELSNLTARVESLESGPDKYIRLDFELLRIELRAFEALVTELKASQNFSSTAIENLFIEIRNMSLIVDQLESYDKSNLEVIRIEFAKLQRKLEKCRDEQDDFSNAPIGSCKHRGILRIGKPIVSQLNADLNAAYRFGGWGKDSLPVGDSEGSYWYSGLGSSLVERISQYSDYYKLIMRQSFKKHELYDRYQYDWHGTGNNYIVRANTFYYQFRTPFSMAKYNMTSMMAQYKVVPKASTLFSYHYWPDQNLDFAADESGLWLTYATEESNGKLMVAKIDEEAFEIKEVWQTSVYRQSVTNVFMVCGVLYATRSVDTGTDEIFYTYNTYTKQENQVSIRFEKFQDLYVYLDYNPTDQKLYMYSNGFYVNYNVKFKPA